MKIKLIKETKFGRSTLQVETTYLIYVDDRLETLTYNEEDAKRIYDAYKNNYVEPITETLDIYETN